MGATGLFAKRRARLDLFLDKRPPFRPRQGKHADGFAFAPEGNPEVGAVAAEPLVLKGKLALRFVGQQINGLNRDTRCRGASRPAAAVDRKRVRLCKRLKLR